jgi:ribulose-5-phosphate 4-epimerase/fuculose-1-phosphate aldolase
MSEGYTRFRCSWAEEPVQIPAALLEALGLWRKRLRDLGLIGALSDGVGFGNISARQGRGFLITGSATGALELLEPRHYALVEETRPADNWLACRGLCRASSESLSHGAVYAALPEAGAVIHVHSAAMWERLADRLPATPSSAGYGTPEIAAAIARLAAAARELPAAIVMGGHRDGILAFGADLQGAGGLLLELLRRAHAERPAPALDTPTPQ